MNPFVEAGVHLHTGDAAGHAAEVGGRSRGHHDRARRPAFDARAQKAEVAQLQRLAAILLLGGIEFLHRQRLARQTRLDNEQVFAAHQPHVRRDHVAGRQLDHIPRHQLLQRDFLRLTVASDRGRDADHRLQLRRRRVRARLLHKPQPHAQHHHQHHHGPAGHIPRGIREGRQHCQQDYQRIAHRHPQAPQPPVPLLARHFVHTVCGQSLFRVRLGQPRRRSVEQREYFVGALSRSLDQQGRDPNRAGLLLGGWRRTHDTRLFDCGCHRTLALESESRICPKFRDYQCQLSAPCVVPSRQKFCTAKVSSPTNHSCCLPGFSTRPRS